MCCELRFVAGFYNLLQKNIAKNYSLNFLVSLKFSVVMLCYLHGFIILIGSSGGV